LDSTIHRLSSRPNRNCARWGITITGTRRGIADRFRIAAKNIAGCNVAFAPDENVFYALACPLLLSLAMSQKSDGSVFDYD
jgi:glucose-1-phosphate thymidylyltransferase